MWELSVLERLDPLSGFVGGVLTYILLTIRKDLIPHYISGILSRKERIKDWNAEVTHVSRQISNMWPHRFADGDNQGFIEIDAQEISKLEEYSAKLSELQQAPSYVDENLVSDIETMYEYCHIILQSDIIVGIDEGDDGFLLELGKSHGDPYDEPLDVIVELEDIAEQTTAKSESQDVPSAAKIVWYDIQTLL